MVIMMSIFLILIRLCNAPMITRFPAEQISEVWTDAADAVAATISYSNILGLLKSCPIKYGATHFQCTTQYTISRSLLLSRVCCSFNIFECTMNTNERTISYWHCFQFYCYVYSFEYIYCNVYPFQQAHIFHIFQFLFRWIRIQSHRICATHNDSDTTFVCGPNLLFSRRMYRAHTVTEPIRFVVTLLLLLLPMPLWNVLHYIRIEQYNNVVTVTASDWLPATDTF